jgi:hypothetical protein
MGQFGSKAMALVLLMALIAAPMAAHIVPSTRAPQPLSAGCHQHGGKSPASKPTSYACCKTGHSTALPQLRFKLRLSCRHVAPLIATLMPMQAGPRTASVPPLLFASPPSSAPLRI